MAGSGERLVSRAGSLCTVPRAFAIMVIVAAMGRRGLRPAPGLGVPQVTASLKPRLWIGRCPFHVYWQLFPKAP